MLPSTAMPSGAAELVAGLTQSGDGAGLLGRRRPDDQAGWVLDDLGLHRLRDLSHAERVFVLRHADGEAGPPPRSLDATPNNLPVQLTSLVGRAAELAAIDRLLTTERLVTLTGAGGSGKTRL